MSSRYASDRGSPEAATLPKMDLVPTLPVVTRLTVDAGVGTAKLSERVRLPRRQAGGGWRGYLGFREMRQQIDSPDGTSKAHHRSQVLSATPLHRLRRSV